jgi:hypothetical protein
VILKSLSIGDGRDMHAFTNLNEFVASIMMDFYLINMVFMEIYDAGGFINAKLEQLLQKWRLGLASCYIRRPGSNSK